MRCAALLTGPFTHLDHLGVLSHELQIPLIVTEEHVLSCAKTFYPQLDVELIPMHELTPEFLAQHWDVLFTSGQFFAQEFTALCSIQRIRPPRIVYSPHGNSDKGHTLTSHPIQDIHLVYGDHMRDLLHKNGAARQIRSTITTGNYRLRFYQKHKAFFDALVGDALRPLPPGRPIVLYAPTWSNEENPSPFLSVVDSVIDALVPSMNLVIKLHPFTYEDHPAALEQLMGRYATTKDVLFLQDFPLIYPLLARCDAYLGDTSSIAYDFLAFDRPLFFLLGEGTPFQSIFSCGSQVTQEMLKSSFSLGINDDFSEKRRQHYAYTFSEVENLRERILYRP